MPKRSQIIPRASQSVPRACPDHPKIDSETLWGRSGPSKTAIAIRTLFAALQRGWTRSVHYIQYFREVLQCYIYSVRIEANPSQVLYIVYGFEVPFWRGQNGFVDRSTVLRGPKVKNTKFLKISPLEMKKCNKELWT